LLLFFEDEDEGEGEGVLVNDKLELKLGLEEEKEDDEAKLVKEAKLHSTEVRPQMSVANFVLGSCTTRGIMMALLHDENEDDSSSKRLSSDT